ncbi:Stp1/IreP family PP2C-type Ser/Thr phosphatase [Radiobacillus sp. PE A8.2]|uniref:Stp1/IreP family PP2C-type Ser/Thr phosphatase n=1 Tax=Radiobacillus sp. PE A8.2 TaxID=3380349 RepID=UPI00388D1141
MNTYFMTDTGQVRSHNEDAGGVFINAHKQVLVVIADGMGGHKAGDVASKMAITSLSEKWQKSEELLLPEDTEVWLKDSISEINQNLFNYAQEHEDCMGMGTTIVAAICTSEYITIAHIGDSRCYLQNNQGFQQITEDHSLVNELVRSGQISKDDAEHHPRKNVLLKALGTEQHVEADVRSIGWEKDDLLLLCSDGLSNKINDEELSEKVKSPSNLEDVANQFISLANERGGEDNISIALVHYDGLDTAEEGVS